MKTTEIFTKLNNGELVLTYKGILKVVKFSKEFEEHYSTQVHDDEGNLLGFLSYYLLKNGIKSYLFMTVSEVKNYAKKYSIGMNKRFGPWVDSFSKMALITVHKLNLMDSEGESYKIISDTIKTIKDEEQDSSFKKLHK